MEPNINADLTSKLIPPHDLTLPLLKDIGWSVTPGFLELRPKRRSNWPGVHAPGFFVSAVRSGTAIHNTQLHREDQWPCIIHGHCCCTSPADLRSD
ncbi:hypothetical protein ACFJGW_05525 [Burkholderiaceae bacterium UC74_6]